MLYVLILLLIITFVLPILCNKIESNLEVFLFVIGIIAVVVSGSINKEFFLNIIENKFMYIITIAVLIGGFIFQVLSTHIKSALRYILRYISNYRIFIECNNCNYSSTTFGRNNQYASNK